MGQVYRGLDTRLDRIVAIKVLPSHLSAQPQFRERFDREARAISSLSHPHICALFDVGSHEGVDYLVMEHLEGESLADRLTRGPLPIMEAVRYGRQIAEALAKAHKQGVVHRDLKPGNVMITRSGAKLLDFGLAKTATAAVLTPDAPTEQQHKPLTAEGTMIGTFQYMAPEQLEGVEADARTDIFAFGAVLYEMVTGRRAFEGKTKTSLIAAIVDRDPPPIASLQPMSPPALERIIRISLAKDPDERWQSAHDLLVQLRWLEEGVDQATQAPKAGRRTRRDLWIGLGLAALVLAVLGFGLSYFARRDRPADSTIEFEVYPPAGAIFNAIDGPAVVSPDGRQLAALAERGQIVIRNLSTREVRALPLTGGAYDLFWSPDSRSIGFFSEGKLKRIDIAGGTARTIASVGDSRGGTWSQSGVILFAPAANAGLSRVSANGGEVTVVTTLDGKRESAHWRPQFLPDGEHFIYFSRGLTNDASGVYAGSLSSMTPVLLAQQTVAPALAPPDLLLSISEGSLLAQRIDTKRWKMDGDPIVVAENVEYSPAFGSLAASASENGTFIWQERMTVPKNTILRLDRSGKELGRFEEEGVFNLDLSRDDTKIAYQRADIQARSEDIWVYDLVRGARSRLTFDPAFEWGPVWSPDGTRVAFASGREAGPGIYEKASSGAGTEKLVFPSPLWVEPVDWSRDDRFLLYESQEGGGDLHLLPLQNDRKPIPLATNPGFREHSGRFSPDSRFVVYVSRETGQNQIYVQPVPPTGARWQISTGGGTSPRWRGDGREILYLHDGKLQSVMVSTSPLFEAAAPRELFDIGGGDYLVTSDGGTFYVNRSGEREPMPIHVVLNWSVPAQ